MATRIISLIIYLSFIAHSGCTLKGPCGNPVTIDFRLVNLLRPSLPYCPSYTARLADAPNAHSYLHTSNYTIPGGSQLSLQDCAIDLTVKGR
jgi:hypothetical protein